MNAPLCGKCLCASATVTPDRLRRRVTKVDQTKIRLAPGARSATRAALDALNRQATERPGAPQAGASASQSRLKRPRWAPIAALSSSASCPQRSGRHRAWRPDPWAVTLGRRSARDQQASAARATPKLDPKHDGVVALGRDDQEVTSLPLKIQLTSRSALAGESEPWTLFSPMLSASLRRVPPAALPGSLRP